MIRLAIQLPNHQMSAFDWTKPVLTMGRAQNNDVVFAAENVSGQHAQILQDGGRYLFRDLRSTNGSILVRRNKKCLLKDDQLEIALEPGDRLFLASMEHVIAVEAIEADSVLEDEMYEKTILAEENARPVDLEISLGDDYEALRSAVRLARELAGLESLHDVAELACQSCMRAYYKARRTLFLVPKWGGFEVEFVCGETGAGTDTASTLLKSQILLDRCLTEHKGFLFLFEKNRMQAIATMAMPAESVDAPGMGQDRVILCCPLFQHDRCYGFLEVEAPLGSPDRHSLTRRDLSLATLMGHLISSRLHDLENQRARLKLARKATAGYLSATVGHCFKNLLFVPMSLSKMLPICLAQGKMDEVQWMLARNNVNIRYLDILSNEFAAASKDPSEGFEPIFIERILEEVALLINQIDPERVEARLMLPPHPMPRVECHGAALRRLFMNLTLNAVDAFLSVNQTGKQAAKGLIELRAEYDEPKAEASLTVHDNGPGIPEAILESLREIYGQVQESADALGDLQNIAERVHSTKDQGFKEHYGLGFLFVCQTVRQHQGRMEVESAPGQGTRFTITIPRHRAGTSPGTIAVE
jgi:signal transduction histidine kinase